MSKEDQNPKNAQGNSLRSALLFGVLVLLSVAFVVGAILLQLQK